MCEAGCAAGDVIKSNHRLKIHVEDVIKLVTFNLSARFEKLCSVQHAHTLITTVVTSE